MDEKLRVALVGFGNMGQHHYAAIEKTVNGTLVAVADKNSATISSAEGELGDLSVFNDVQEMLDRVNPDVVHVVTPPETHFEIAKMSLEAGAHVYVEKPFTLSTEKALELLDAAATNGRRVCPAHQVLFQRSGRKYREKLELIGEVVLAESYFSFRPVRRSPTGGGRIDPVDQLIDILPHPVYLLLDALHIDDNSKSAVEVQSIEVTAGGDACAILRKGNCIGLLTVTVRGRPVESFLKIVGTNGSVNADFVLSGVTTLPGPGASAVSQILIPFSQGFQRFFGTVASVFRILTGRQGSYDGLTELFEQFYTSLSGSSEPPISTESLVETVRVCELVGKKVLDAKAMEEAESLRELAEAEIDLPEVSANEETLLVTGGTGFLGREFVQLARRRGCSVRVMSRQIPRAKDRVPGVEYVEADLAQPLSSGLFENVGVVVHLAAETEGGREAHERNSILATKNLIDGCSENDVSKFVNISSVAVMQTSARFGRALDETTPLDSDNIGRGPYVWGKAKAEELVTAATHEGVIAGKNVRLGPLVDFQNYVPPGRLGRELGNLFVVMGNPWDLLPICGVDTAANVIFYYVSDFDNAPDLLNLFEPGSPKRSELWRLHKKQRPELKGIWVLKPFLIAISSTIKIALRLRHPKSKPLDIYAAFASEKYDTSLAQDIVVRANRSEVD